MNRFQRIVTGPIRLARRFNDWCETPGSIEGVIAYIDAWLLPMIAVCAASLLAGLVLAGLLAYFFTL